MTNKEILKALKLDNFIQVLIPVDRMLTHQYIKGKAKKLPLRVSKLIDWCSNNYIILPEVRYNKEKKLEVFEDGAVIPIPLWKYQLSKEFKELKKSIYQNI